MKLSSYILQFIEKEGVRDVFLVPGGMIDPMLEALSTQSEVKPFVAAHEEGATFMADGYARASGKFGAVFAISGPGVANTTSGIATAYADRSPVLLLSGEVKMDWEGRGSFQDSSSAGINSMLIMESITSMQCTISTPELIHSHLERLFRNMLSHSSRGPVHIALPTNIQSSEIEPHAHKKLPDVLYHPRFIDRGACEKVWETLQGVEKVAILAGTGTLNSGSGKELLAFAERFEIPVATTLGAKGTIPEDHRLSLGVLGWFGTRHAIETLLSGEIEVLIVTGSRLSMLDTLVWSHSFKPKRALILNDINSNSVYRDYVVDLPVLGDSKEFFSNLNRTAPTQGKHVEATVQKRKEWLAQIRSKGPRYYHPEALQSDAHPIHPARIIGDLRKVMPRDTILVVDTGAHGFFAGHYWTSYDPGQFFTSIKYMGCMGWAIGAAVGVQVAKPNVPCVALTGYGCMLMHGMEVQTAARYNLPVIFVVMNNSALGNPQLRAERISPAMAKLHDLPTHDWAKFGESLGAVGFRVKDAKDLTQTFQKALQLKKTVVIDIISGNYPTPTEAFDRQFGLH